MATVVDDTVVRMMMKMGYKPGEGLGKSASGEVQLAADKMITSMKRSPFDRVGIGHTAAASTSTYMDYNFYTAQERIEAKFAKAGQKRSRAGSDDIENPISSTAKRARVADPLTKLDYVAALVHGVIPLSVSAPPQAPALASPTIIAAKLSSNPKAAATSISAESSCNPPAAEGVKLLGGKRLSIAQRRKSAAASRRQSWLTTLKGLIDCPLDERRQCNAAECPHGLRHLSTRMGIKGDICSEWRMDPTRVGVNSLPCKLGANCLLRHPPIHIVRATDCAKFLLGRCRQKHCILRHSTPLHDAKKVKALEICPHWIGNRATDPSSIDTECENVPEGEIGGCAAGVACTFVHPANTLRPHLGDFGELLTRFGTPVTSKYISGLMVENENSKLHSSLSTMCFAAIPPVPPVAPMVPVPSQPHAVHTVISASKEVPRPKGVPGKTADLHAVPPPPPPLSSSQNDIDVVVCMRDDEGEEETGWKYVPSSETADEEYNRKLLEMDVHSRALTDGKNRPNILQGTMDRTDVSWRWTMFDDNTGVVTGSLWDEQRVIRNKRVMCRDFNALAKQSTCVTPCKHGHPHPRVCPFYINNGKANYCKHNNAGTCPFYHHVATIPCKFMHTCVYKTQCFFLHQ
jgi:hypothetical protein